MSLILFLHLSLQGSLHVKYLSVFHGQSLHFLGDFSCFCSLPVCFHLCMCLHPLCLLEMYMGPSSFSPFISPLLLSSHTFFHYLYQHQFLWCLPLALPSLPHIFVLCQFYSCHRGLSFPSNIQVLTGECYFTQGSFFCLSTLQESIDSAWQWLALCLWLTALSWSHNSLLDAVTYKK